MNAGSTFDTNAALALLLIGESGTGKSSLAMRFPDPGFVLGDKNIRHAAEWAAARSLPWFYGDPLIDKEGKPVPEPLRWARSMEILREMGTAPEVKTIIDDGLTHLSDYLKVALISQSKEVLLVGGDKVMTKSLWGPFADNLKRRITVARSFGKPYVMIAHIGMGENEITDAKEFRVLLQGSLKNEIAAWFSDVWQVDAVPSSDAKYKETRGIRYFVRTAATHRIKLKASDSTLPPELEMGELVRRLKLRGEAAV